MPMLIPIESSEFCTDVDKISLEGSRSKVGLSLLANSYQLLIFHHLQTPVAYVYKFRCMYMHSQTANLNF